MSARSVTSWEVAAESLDLAVAPRIRPNPLLWLWYVYWGPLPQRHAIWVLYDATCSSWVLRHVGRIVVAAVVPVGAIAIFLPAPVGIRLLTAFAAGFYAIVFTAVWINESTEQRLVRAGYEWGTGPALRTKRDEIAQRLRNW